MAARFVRASRAVAYPSATHWSVWRRPVGNRAQSPGTADYAKQSTGLWFLLLFAFTGVMSDVVERWRAVRR